MSTRKNTISRPASIAAAANRNTSSMMNHRSQSESSSPSKWQVKDTGLRPIPAFSPPLDPNCTIYVCDASPSIVATRLENACRRGNISVEYDNDAASATAMTVERVFFNMQLYRGSKAAKVDGQMLDFSQGVIVEIVRVRGSSLSFHPTCRALLNAAIGHSDGTTTTSHKRKVCSSPLSYDRLSSPGDENDNAYQSDLLPPPFTKRAKSTETEATVALEHAVSLLQKDRHGAQMLGMETLVNLTDAVSSGREIAIHSSLAVLGAPVMSEETLSQIPTWIVSLARDRKLPGEQDEASLDTADISFEDSITSGQGAVTSSLASSPDRKNSSTSTPAPKPNSLYAEHVAAMRSLALRVVTNAVSVISRERSSMLKSTLITNSAVFVSEPFLCSLLEDLAGASRPPCTLFASAHETAYCCRILAVLMEHSKEACRTISNALGKANVLEAFDRAEGSASMVIVEQEARRAHAALSRGIYNV